MKCERTGKERHISQGKAKAHLRSLQTTGYVGVVYSCQHCFGWHVGREKISAHKSKYKQTSR